MRVELGEVKETGEVVGGEEKALRWYTETKLASSWQKPVPVPVPLGSSAQTTPCIDTVIVSRTDKNSNGAVNVFTVTMVTGNFQFIRSECNVSLSNCLVNEHFYLIYRLMVAGK
jgi:hypothetical protein